ncbi:MAG: hypothetical protein L0170_15640 [Acidobacteria bacterium]|nr:hypothetical protein [Acidobacteriota bacterium]
MRLPIGVVLVLALLLALPASAPAAEKEEADDLDSPQEISAAIFTLKVQQELEKSRLDRNLADYDAAQKRRVELSERVSLLYERLGTAIRRGSTPPEEDDEESLTLQIESAQRAEELTRQTMRRLQEQIADSRERIRFIQDRLSKLHRPAAEEPEGITGTWDITYLPSNDKAVFILRQSTALIEGEYQQVGGFKGSLQGTYINGKLVLHRIDSKLGAVSDLEGQVSADLKSIKGTWLSRIIGDGTPVNGAWSGKKRETRKKGDGTAP